MCFVFFSNLYFSQTIAATNGTANPCWSCAPTGWTIGAGTPDISNGTVAAAVSGTAGGGGANWTSAPGGTTNFTIPNPPNTHTTWISLRDLGGAGTEESVTTTVGALTIGRTYEIVVFSATAVTRNNGAGGVQYAGTYITQYIAEIAGQTIPVTGITTNGFSVSRIRFTATAASHTLLLRPGNNATAGTPTAPIYSGIRTIQISVTGNASMNTVPVAINDNTQTAQNVAVSGNVVTNDSDLGGGALDVASVDLNPSVAGIQTTFTNAQGSWSVNASGVVTFTPVPSFFGIATIPYTVQDNFTINGVSAPATSQPANIYVVVYRDTDGDGTPDYLDLDDDNDGIPDAVENSCETEGTAVYNENFGTGATTGTNASVINHTYVAVAPPDGSYSVTTSGAQGTGTTNTYSRTDLNGERDAANTAGTAASPGTTAGRYLFININSPASVNLPIYAVDNLTVVPGTKYRFRIDMAGLANAAADVPRLQLSIRDGNGNLLASANSNSIGMANDDIWRRLSLGFVATTSTVSIQIVNLQPTGGSGNDLAIDNVVLVPLNICDTDGDGIENSLDLDSDNDGILDAVECPIANLVTNGSFATDASNWTLGTGWTYSALLGYPYNVNENLTATGGSSLSQSITNLNTVPGNVVSLSVRIGAQDASQAAGNTASLQIILNGVIYATLSNSTLRNASNVTIAYSNGASGNFTIFGTENVNGFRQSAPFTINIPYTGPNTALLEFKMFSGSDDWSVDDVSILGISCDSDGDGIPNYLDTDSDNDGCADAIEGTEAVRFNQIHSLTLPVGNANYAYRGQIKMVYDGVTTGTPAQVISTSALANGVPQLVNNAGNNLNATTNPSNLVGLADNTDGTADIGQGIGTSQNNAARDVECDRCFRPATTVGTTLPTNHGITALGRAGSDNGNWPMKINGAYTALDAKTKGFVINRLPFTGSPSVPTGITAANYVVGMMVYDTTNNCLKIYDGTGWYCYTKQTCDNINQ
ncbi:Ig-like domain-containing protein [Chryseobacterium sp. 09-1422]|uniref:Ig-like domain-containing protein n=1 Tax=Chryseobacterium kimseyorum TaxID=2984028 RepID=A0ABT3HY82_9FLAO|nr:Ig-like domain-containing protein [Chryseobacterium kimseyorum]MCW3168665.1 Ig-like domain-containing protein [Chryseobacterium kimseyorum]